MALCLMKRLQMAGNKPVVLIGGGTAMIGDPSGRTDMRSMMTISFLVVAFIETLPFLMRIATVRSLTLSTLYIFLGSLSIIYGHIFSDFRFPPSAEPAPKPPPVVRPENSGKNADCEAIFAQNLLTSLAFRAII